MMRLPTVKLQHKRTGEVKIVNATDYARDIGGNTEWKIITLKHGDAPDPVIGFLARQSDKEQYRKRYGESGQEDQARALEERSDTVNDIVTEPTEYATGPSDKPGRWNRKAKVWEGKKGARQEQT